MIIIGLSGGIATGKGVVAACWAAMPGVVVVDADVVVHELYQPASPMVQVLIQAFGKDILTPAGGVDRKALGAIVFGDEIQRQRLNDIVHPAVRKRYVELSKQAQQQGAQVFVIEAALLLDGVPDPGFFHAIVTTEVEVSEQLRRLMERDRLSESEARRRIVAQLPQTERRKRADYVLDTSGTVAQTRLRAQRLMAQLRERFG